MKNLWPDSFSERKIEAPRTIFEFQAKLLSKLTGDIVYAQVSELDYIDCPRPIRNEFNFKFSIRGKLLENYNFTILVFTHDITFYPISLKINEDISEELKLDDLYEVVSKEEDLENLLEMVLRSD